MAAEFNVTQRQDNAVPPNVASEASYLNLNLEFSTTKQITLGGLLKLLGPQFCQV